VLQQQRKTPQATAPGTDGHVVHVASPALAPPGLPADAPLSLLRWYALRLRNRSEFAVRDALDRQGIESFLPTWEERSSWSDRIAKITRPLFTGYLFSRFVPELAQDAVLRTRGVVQILGIPTGKPEAIPDAVIRNLQLVAANPAALSPCAYVVGQWVAVVRGPFAGACGTVSRVKENPLRLTIPVEILGRAVSVQIDAADIEQETV
jgi:transcription antitermination factor NusG